MSLARAAWAAGVAALAIAAPPGAPASAESPRAVAAAGAADTFDAAYRDWARKHRIRQGVLAVAAGEKIVLLKSYGGLDPHAPVPLASLSKAITGACVATLVRDGKLSLSTKLGAVLAPLFRRLGEPADPRVKSVTVDQLLIHRSGFSRSANADPASGTALVAQLRESGGGKPAIDAAMERAMAYRLARPPGQRYEYVNANYLILGAVIEQVSGRPYETYCREAVLRPMGAAGHLGAKWAALSAYGGWSLSAADYLRFLQAFDRASGITDAATWRWMLTPGGKSLGKGPDAHYALGVVVRREPSGPAFLHTGLWTHAQADAADGPLADSHATLAVKSPIGLAWFVYMAPQPPNAARFALDRALWRVHDSLRAPSARATAVPSSISAKSDASQ